MTGSICLNTFESDIHVFLLKTDYFQKWPLNKTDMSISIPETSEELSKLNTEKQWYLHDYWSDKDVKSHVVNRRVTWNYDENLFKAFVCLFVSNKRQNS